MSPTFTCFYTLNTIYEKEAARLRRSLDRLGLPYDLRGIKDRGSWAANAGFTANFLCDMLAEYTGRPLIYLDADAIVWQRPVLLDLMSTDTTDIAAHRTPWGELLNGTLWLGNTPACVAVIQDYRDRVLAAVGEKNEQRHLDLAIGAMPGLRVKYLPSEYCLIHDLMALKGHAHGEPVIEHLQASRVASRSSLLPSRLRRLAEIEPIFGEGDYAE